MNITDLGSACLLTVEDEPRHTHAEARPRQRRQGKARQYRSSRHKAEASKFCASRWPRGEAAASRTTSRQKNSIKIGSVVFELCEQTDITILYDPPGSKVSIQAACETTVKSHYKRLSRYMLQVAPLYTVTDAQLTISYM